MDIRLAQTLKERILVECKFHNKQQYYSDLKTSLYVKARFDDINAQKSGSEKFTTCLLATNTKFTRNAIRYSECAGIKLLSWGYPIFKFRINFI